MEKEQEISEWPRQKPPRNARQKRKEVEVDMNPMVDLAFLLLTFFMLATTFAKPQIMDLIMPVIPEDDVVEQEQAIKESQALTIILSIDNKIYWYEGISDPKIQEIDHSKENIRPLLVERNEMIEKLVILIKPMPNSRYENLIDLLDEINSIGIKRYALTEVNDFDLSLLSKQAQNL